jgi:hypothetical protein
MNLFQDISKIKDLLSNYFKDYKTLEKQREKLAQERDIIANLPKSLESVIEEASNYIDKQIVGWRRQFAEKTLVTRCHPGSAMEGSAAINEWFKGHWTGQFAPEVNPDAMFFFFAPKIKEVLADEIRKLPEPVGAIATADRIKKLAELDKQIATLDSQLAELDKVAKENGLVKPLGDGYLVVNLEAEDFVDRGGDPNELQELKKLKKRFSFL